MTALHSSSRLVALAALTLAAPAAFATTWTDYGSLFEGRPCADGWMACVIEGNHHTSESVRSGEQVSAPANARVDFLSLAPTGQFEPFGVLSDYAAISPSRGPQIPAAVLREAVVAVPEPPPVVEPATSGKQVKAPPVDEPLLAEDRDHGDAEDLAEEDDAVGLVTEAAACEDPSALEGLALIGRLDAGARTCLEDRIRTSSDSENRAAASLLLIQNAWKADRAAWTALAARHLEEVDPTHAGLAFALAQQSQRDGDHAAVLRWTAIADAHKTKWSGGTYTSRVNTLLKLRAAATYALWRSAAEAPDQQGLRDAQRHAEAAARAWLGHASTAGLDTDEAQALCEAVSFAGRPCEP